MKHAYFLLVALAFCIAGCKQHDCRKFRTGKYIMELSDGHTDTLRRWATYQTERSDTMKTYDTLAVAWLDSCTYTLTPTPFNARRHPRMPPNTVLTVKIDETHSDYYRSITTANTGDIELHDKIVKISADCK